MNQIKFPLSFHVESKYMISLLNFQVKIMFKANWLTNPV